MDTGGLVVLAIVAVAAIITVLMFAGGSARTVPAPAQTAGDLRRVKVRYVLDGDTVIVSDAWSDIRVRLDSIDCPEEGQDWGNTAKAGLIKLIGGRHVHIESHGTDIHGRTLATIYVRHAQGSDWINVNERMVMLGHAWVSRMHYHHLPGPRRHRLTQLERWARSKRVGLWKSNGPIPPWEWRKGPEGLVDEQGD
ncbi:MAG: thermonuclease family protein [Burkholderiales bacterium]|nr:thermonuclease family protein [Burkholderiales bacterium]